MNKEDAIRFAGLMEEYLNIPAFVCEMIEQQLKKNKYKEVVEYVIQRRNEIENKLDYMTEQEKIKIFESKDKEISRLNNIIEELEKWLEYEIYCNFNKEMTKGYKDTLNQLKELKEGNNNE